MKDRATRSAGLIRMALMAAAFICLTIVLIVFQPGSPRKAQDFGVPTTSVTRETPPVDPVTPPETTAIAAIAVVAPQPAPQSIPRTTGAEPTMRDMTFGAIANVKAKTTGEAPAPGQPGSLLHSVVRKSLTADQTASSAQSAPPGLSPDTLGSYFVRPGDTLNAIAITVYGTADMADALFAANADVLARPESLRTGMVLRLPLQ